MKFSVCLNLYITVTCFFGSDLAAFTMSKIFIPAVATLGERIF